VSHLGDLLSALVDGELSGAELDRANAHLAACDFCQAEASGLRDLKLKLRALAESCQADAITRRLLAMPDALAAPREDGSPAAGFEQPFAYSGGGAVVARPLAPSPGSSRRRGPLAPRRGRRRGRYVLWGTVSLVVVGIGGAAFGIGGGSGGTQPRITPPVEVFDVEHALTSGDVPFPSPADSTSRGPVVAARP
jgi:anti-sigma factor RsiW